MERRNFLQATGALGVSALTGAAPAVAQDPAPAAAGFKLKYAPHFGMFQNVAKGGLVEELKYAADQGFRAWEDNGMAGRSVQEQELIAKTMADLGIEMGVFVASAQWGKVTFAGQDQAARDQVVKSIADSVEVAKRVNAKWMTVVLDEYARDLEWGFQTANCIDLLRRCCEILEPHGLVMVLEPLNWWTNHAGVFLHKIPQAFEICRAVDSPSCKILFDLYHQQIQEGNLIPNIDKAWSEIGYFQSGDNPGRNEPGTGEINYGNVFKHIHAKGFDGVIGMEHGNSQEGADGDRAVVAAYQAADDF